eukprot:377388-Prorocentrum_minimum.AAC.2
MGFGGGSEGGPEGFRREKGGRHTKESNARGAERLVAPTQEFSSAKRGRKGHSELACEERHRMLGRPSRFRGPELATPRLLGIPSIPAPRRPRKRTPATSPRPKLSGRSTPDLSLKTPLSV